MKISVMGINAADISFNNNHDLTNYEENRVWDPSGSHTAALLSVGANGSVYYMRGN